jgi:hypothetical protein
MELNNTGCKLRLTQMALEEVNLKIKRDTLTGSIYLKTNKKC